MPAAAVIPAPIAYIKVVAVKKLVVEFLCLSVGSSSLRPCGRCILGGWRASAASPPFTVKKLECLKQAWLEYISME